MLDSAGRLPVGGQLASTARDVPVWVAVTGRAGAERRAALVALGCEVLAFPGEGGVPVEPLLEELGRRGVTNLLVEGGSRVLGSFFEARQIDAVDVYIAPVLEGGSGSFTPVAGPGVARMVDALRLERHEIAIVDGDVRVRGTLASRWAEKGSGAEVWSGDVRIVS